MSPAPPPPPFVYVCAHVLHIGCLFFMKVMCLIPKIPNESWTLKKKQLKKTKQTGGWQEPSLVIYTCRIQYKQAKDKQNEQNTRQWTEDKTNEQKTRWTSTRQDKQIENKTNKQKTWQTELRRQDKQAEDKTNEQKQDKQAEDITTEQKTRQMSRKQDNQKTNEQKRRQMSKRQDKWAADMTNK